MQTMRGHALSTCVRSMLPPGCWSGVWGALPARAHAWVYSHLVARRQKEALKISMRICELDELRVHAQAVSALGVGVARSVDAALV